VDDWLRQALPTRYVLVHRRFVVCQHQSGGLSAACVRSQSPLGELPGRHPALAGLNPIRLNRRAEQSVAEGDVAHRDDLLRVHRRLRRGTRRAMPSIRLAQVIEESAS
jgi:hypothetical protein